MDNISITVSNHLCTSCGVCKAVCPRHCISWHMRDGMYEPEIDPEQCIGCGLCSTVCPGLGHGFEPRDTAAKTVTGQALQCFNAWSRNAALRHVSASGGVVSTLTKKLLEAGKYDVAFSLDSYDYRSQLTVRPFTADNYGTDWDHASTPKSRYLPVSHEEAVSRILRNPHERMILVGTPCALRGIQAVIRKWRRDREQYLLIGLFCDKIFNYNSLRYFEDRFCPGQTLTALHFKNKESGGWPGDMKFFLNDGSTLYVPLQQRAGAKDYFMPERCLYCVDKLNASADISLGDNYTGLNESSYGSNSVIIRTRRGMDAWQEGRDALEAVPVPLEAIEKAQAVDMRLENLYFGDLKSEEMGKGPDLNPGVPRERDPAPMAKSRRLRLARLRTGALYDADPRKLEKQLRRDHRKPNILKRAARRGLRLIRRKRI